MSTQVTRAPGRPAPDEGAGERFTEALAYTRHLYAMAARMTRNPADAEVRTWPSTTYRTPA
jgi:hypothetical protein